MLRLQRWLYGRRRYGSGRADAASRQPLWLLDDGRLVQIENPRSNIIKRKRNHVFCITFIGLNVDLKIDKRRIAI